MPKHVRNFWARVEVDGREHALAGGPAARDGGMDLTVYQRSAGEVVEALSVTCRALPDGTLRLRVWRPGAVEPAAEVITQR